MSESLSSLPGVVSRLSAAAQQLNLTDAAWAARAGVRKESLSRLRRRKDCDWATLDRLAKSVGCNLSVQPASLRPTTPDGHLPAHFSRDDEARLRELIYSGDVNQKRWLGEGPAFFMGGLAMLLACTAGFDRRNMVQLADALHPGMSEPAVLNLWLQSAPIEPSRFLAQLEAERGRTALR